MSRERRGKFVEKGDRRGEDSQEGRTAAQRGPQSTGEDLRQVRGLPQGSAALLPVGQGGGRWVETYRMALRTWMGRGRRKVAQRGPRERHTEGEPSQQAARLKPEAAQVSGQG